MAEDWVTIKIPRLMALDIDKFKDTDVARKNGIFSRGDFVVGACAKILADYEKAYGLFRTRESKGKRVMQTAAGDN